MTKAKVIKALSEKNLINKKIRGLVLEQAHISDEINKLNNILSEIKLVVLIENIPVRVLPTVDGFKLVSPTDNPKRWAFVESHKPKYMVKFFTGSSEKFKSSSMMTKKQALISAAKWIDEGTMT